MIRLLSGCNHITFERESAQLQLSFLLSYKVKRYFYICFKSCGICNLLSVFNSNIKTVSVFMFNGLKNMQAVSFADYGRFVS